jgi:hypothetical protein
MTLATLEPRDCLHGSCDHFFHECEEFGVFIAASCQSWSFFGVGLRRKQDSQSRLMVGSSMSPLFEVPRSAPQIKHENTLRKYEKIETLRLTSTGSGHESPVQRLGGWVRLLLVHVDVRVHAWL